MTGDKKMPEFQSPVQKKINKMIKKARENTPPRTGKKAQSHYENRITEKRQVVHPRNKVAHGIIQKPRDYAEDKKEGSSSGRGSKMKIHGGSITYFEGFMI